MRYLGFDLLRGLCAIGVASYHVFFWSGVGEYPVLGRYFVYTFFALSGASIYIGYAGRIASGYSLRNFYVARFGRIAPLYWSALFAQALYSAYAGNDPFVLSLSTLLNASLMFGFAAPGSTSIVVGGWSLGIEFVFYLLFPIIALTLDSRRLVIATCVAWLLQFAFVNVMLPHGTLDATNWGLYTNPAAFAFYFLAGCLIGNAMVNISPQRKSLFAIFAVLSFLLLTVYGFLEEGQVHLTGWPGLILPPLVATIVLGWGCLQIKSRWGALLASGFGNASYGMYLLHPMVHFALRHTLWQRETPIAIQLAEMLVITFALALVVDKLFERPVRRFIQNRFGTDRSA